MIFGLNQVRTDVPRTNDPIHKVWEAPNRPTTWATMLKGSQPICFILRAGIVVSRRYNALQGVHHPNTSLNAWGKLQRNHHSGSIRRAHIWHVGIVPQTQRITQILQGVGPMCRWKIPIIINPLTAKYKRS